MNAALRSSFPTAPSSLSPKASDGKLTPAAIQEIATKRQDIHYPKPRAVTIRQSTETGRVYTAEELRALSPVCRQTRSTAAHGRSALRQCLRQPWLLPAELTWKSGVDVLCFGGTKNGMAVGEAILFFDRKLAEDFDYRCKQAGQLASKMRFLAAPWVGMLESGAWLRNAAHANACARYLADQLSGIPGVEHCLAPGSERGVRQRIR